MKIDASPLQGTLNIDQSGLADADSALDALNKTLVFGPDATGGQAGDLSGNIVVNAAAAGDNNNTFKFRLKSKHTGKIVDLNVKFKVRENQTNETIPTCGDNGGAFIEQNYPEAGSDTMHEGAGSDDSGNNEGHSW